MKSGHGAAGLSRLPATLLFEVQPLDLPIAVIAGLDCYVPVRRALRIDPGLALREE